MDDPSWNSHCRAVIGNVFKDNRIGADAHATADGNAADNLRASADEHIVPQNGRLVAFGANRDLVLNQNVSSAAHLAIDHHARGMDQDKAWTGFSSPANDPVA